MRENIPDNQLHRKSMRTDEGSKFSLRSQFFSKKRAGQQEGGHRAIFPSTARSRRVKGVGFLLERKPSGLREVLLETYRPTQSRHVDCVKRVN